MSTFFLRLLAILLALPLLCNAQSVGIGTTAPAASAALEIKSTTGGLLLPRMTAAERAAIANPVQGLFVFQTDGTPGLYYYIGSAWVNLASGLIPDAGGGAGGSPSIQVSTLAGSGVIGSGNNNTGTSAAFAAPSGVALDGLGNLYVADVSNNRIRKIVIATGVVTTLAGSVGGYLEGTGTAARFSATYGVACDGGNVYVADAGNYRIRKVNAGTGDVTTLAGSGTAGTADGTGTAAQFGYCYGITTDGLGNLYVVDGGNNRIRRIVIATGVVTTLAGGTAGYVDAMGTAAQFNNPRGAACDGSGNVYVADANNHSIRKIDAGTGRVTTLAGSGTFGNADGVGTAAQFNSPQGVTVDGSGNVYVGDTGNHRIRKIAAGTGVVTTLAGTASGFADGTGGMAKFNALNGMVMDSSGKLYVADVSNNRIRIVK